MNTLSSLCAIVLYFSVSTATDDTLIPGESGKDVVVGVLDKIENSCVFTKDKQMLRHIAYAESEYKADNANGGIWKVPSAIFQSTKALTAYTQQFQSKFGVNWASATYADLAKPLYSGLAARLALAAQETSSGYIDGNLPWNINDQANNWKRAYNKAESLADLQRRYNTAVQSVRDDVCKSKVADIAFVLDSSGSIPPLSWVDTKNFVREVIRNFDVGPQAAQFGIITFSNGVAEEIRLNQYHDKNQLMNAVSNLRHIAGGTDTAAALQRLRTFTYQTQNGARYGSSKLAVTLTDGQSNNPTFTAQQAQLIHDTTNITMLSVGMGTSISAQELRNIASEPKCMNVYQLRQFADLVQAFVIELRQRICEEPAIIQVETLTTDPVTGQQLPPKPNNMELQVGDYNSYCVNIPTDSDTTIIMKTKKGKAKVFVSFKTRKPNSAMLDMGPFSFAPSGKSFSLKISRQDIALYAPDPNQPTARLCMGFEATSGTKSAEAAEIEFSAVKGVFVECGGKLQLRPGEVYDEQGLGFFGDTPVGYPANIKCTWNIADTPGHYFLIEFPFFNLTSDTVEFYSKGKCDDNSDRVHIWSTTSNDKIKKTRDFCGTNKYSVEMFGPLKIEFKSKREGAAGSGFNMKITAKLDLKTSERDRS